MRKVPHLNAVLQRGGFALHGLVCHLLNVGFLTQCFMIAAVSACFILAASITDGTLFLKGRDIGLLQHPGIWVSFSLQIALPLAIGHSLRRLIRSQARIRAITKFDGSLSEVIIAPILRFLRLEDPASRLVATILYCAGLSAFVWNTYQNQLPGIIIPFDFWDSKNHFFGFWISRIYKFYLLFWLLPYIALVHVAILVVILRTIRKARLDGRLKLIPFHPDGVGGFGFVPTLVTTPVLVTLLLGSISTAATFEVHRAADVTPILSSAIIVVSAVIAYLVPMAFLRSDIVALKHELIQKLRLLEQKYYSKIIEEEQLNFKQLSKGNEVLDYFDRVCSKVQAISNYPHFPRVLTYSSLALAPSIISLVMKLYEYMKPIISHISKKP